MNEENIKKNDISEIIKKLEEGVKSIFDGEEFKKFLKTLSKFHDYS